MNELMERLGRIEQRLLDLEKVVDRLCERIEKQNGRLWALNERGAALSGRMAVVLVAFSAALSAALSVVVQLIAR